MTRRVMPQSLFFAIDIKVWFHVIVLAKKLEE